MIIFQLKVNLMVMLLRHGKLKEKLLRSNLSDSYSGTTFTMGTEDLTFTAVFDGADTNYKVHFWKQNAEW